MKRIHFWLAVCIAALAMFSVPALLSAAPSQPEQSTQISAQIPDWMSAETASRLAIGIDVYAPSWVPGPFSGEPDIQAYDGYYSLYWLIPGVPPTFLRVTGEAGGSIPAYSYYDRNVQLQQNATVMGYPAWHDVTPIYDLVYWQIGNVVYTVESFSLTSDTTMSLVNNLMLVTPPAQTGGQQAETPETPATRSISLGVPESVQSGQTASIGVIGEGSVLLSAQDGYFAATGENSAVVEGGGSVDWVAPEYESDATLYFYAYDPDSGAELASASTYLDGFLSEGETVAVEVQCPTSATMGKQARLVITGNGSLQVVASGGSVPAESPNTDFDTTATGGSSLVGTLPDQATATLSWLAPEAEGTYYISIFDMNDSFLAECAIDAVTEDVGENFVAGDGSLGDGTGVTDVDPAIVLRVIANPNGFAGDASGGPEANGPDYGYQSEAVDAPEEETEDEEESTAAASTVDQLEVDLGPSTGADGMVALAMGSRGGILENPAGARIIVPQGALEDQTTVMLQPIPDHELPKIAGIELIPGTAFDVAFSAADGRAAEPLKEPAQLTISLDSAVSDPSAKIYRIDGPVAKPMSMLDLDQGSVTTEVSELSRYVVGVPAPAVAGTTRSFNPFIVGGLAIIALISAGLLISQGLTRRRTRIVPVRRPVPSRVRYR